MEKRHPFSFLFFRNDKKLGLLPHKPSLLRNYPLKLFKPARTSRLFFCPFQICLKFHAPPRTTPPCWSCNLVQQKKEKKKKQIPLYMGEKMAKSKGRILSCPPCSNLFLLAERRLDVEQLTSQFRPNPQSHPGLPASSGTQHACVGEIFTMRQQRLLKCHKEEFVVAFQKKKKSIMTQ